MRVTITFIKESCAYQGMSLYQNEIRCNVCNDTTKIAYEYESVDPDYRRSFHICQTCKDQL